MRDGCHEKGIDKKRAFGSITLGIFLALVLLISCNLSVSDAMYTLATVEHVPEGGLPLLLEEIRDDREALTEEDIRLLGSIFDMEKLAQYDPSVSDPIKSGFRQDVSKREIFPVLAHKWVDFLESRGAKDDMMSGKGHERTCRYGQDD